MTSLLTNHAAMVALQTLNQINQSLNTTNNRVSTGLRINKASDSAAYWAIATTTDSDNGALGAVRDALAIGKSTLDVAYNGLETTRESLQKMKELLVSARQPGVNRANVQTELDGLITDMQNKAGASVINEQNFLEADSTGNTIKAVVASFERSSAGIAISHIELDIASVILVDTGANAGILDQSRTVGAAGPQQWVGSIIDIAGGALSAITDSADDLGLLENMIQAVDDALTEVISAQNTIGVNLARAESQEIFVDALMDANTRAVGALIDANMEEESTKLRALQTQQQLSVESLAIANAAAQNVLALFR
ncbi:flagellin N-terminal helical domain-containing protein [Acuticoccus yangtzensis]|uniref:flagellin N-terminal helical domain-containing protein n=1 Tax=Acuticoccus yangtzensis TaxID=1443441 RepID=UPI000949ABF7|nr:flagellin [Acuticoccus yangtzensis]ORE95789.1 flagellin-like protein [Stappia sp. 22II-S9-Z10]